MSDPKHCPFTIPLGTLKAGTVITTGLLRDLIEKRPLQAFDLELKAEHVEEVPRSLPKDQLVD